MKLSDEALLRFFRSHPTLRERMASIVGAVKLCEHYGVEIGESTIQRVTLRHGQAIFESERELFACAVRAGFGTDSFIHAVGDGAPIPGAWWRVEHADHMLALRINRLNGDWEDYWAALAANPPPPANWNRPNLSRKHAD